MKCSTTLLVTALLGLGTAACGSSSGSHPPPRPVATPSHTVTRSDSIAVGPDSILDYGHPADETDRRAVVALVRRYYEAAAAIQGATACSMSGLEKATVEDYGHDSAGPTYLKQGRTCPQVMTLLFKHFHRQLAAEVPALAVVRVRLEQDHGYAVLRFGKRHKAYIFVDRVDHIWKIGSLLDTPLE